MTRRKIVKHAAMSLVSMMFCGWAYGQSCAGITAGQLTSLNGFVPFGASSLWNTDISNAPVDPNSINIISFIGAGVSVHADFGSGTYQKSTIGIPYQVVPGSQAKVNVTLGAYADESDPGPMPIPSNALIEGYPNPGTGDRHVLVLDKDGCWLYELFNAAASRKGKWSADAAVLWDMLASQQRPYTWTSADAAGLPIFPGLARHDEVAAGAINHALRFTVPTTRQAFVAPATHWASSNTSLNAPPMGTRLRLRSTFDISGFPQEEQVILTALKKYGMILADNGSAIFLSGAPDNGWNNSNLHLLGAVHGSDFEVIQMSNIVTPSNVPAGAGPVITSFSGPSGTVSKGTAIVLSWNITGGTYNVISPQIGPVRGSNIMIVAPSSTTTYTLTSTNSFGRSSRAVTVTVH